MSHPRLDVPGSVRDLTDRAERSLEMYCDPASKYAWPHYDIDHSPDTLTATDLLAPALLSYAIRGAYLQQLLQQEPEPNPYTKLRIAMEQVLDATDADRFDDVPVDEVNNRNQPKWGSVRAAFDAAQHCHGLTAVAVSKVLHRKRPELIPLIDSRVYDFYAARTLSDLLMRIHSDLTDNTDLLDKWRKPYRLADGRPMTRLRALDIVIWMRNEPLP